MYFLSDESETNCLIANSLFFNLKLNEPQNIGILKEMIKYLEKKFKQLIE